MSLTIPQVMMLNHAAWLEKENGDIRYEHKKKVDEWVKSNTAPDPVINEFGKTLSELDDRQLATYLTDWSDFA